MNLKCCTESMGWLHSWKFPSVPSVRYSLIVKSKMQTFMFQIGKLEKGWRKWSILVAPRILDKVTLSLPYPTSQNLVWPATVEAKNCSLEVSGSSARKLCYGRKENNTGMQMRFPLD